MKTQKLIIWGHRNAVVKRPDHVSSVSWYFSGRVDGDKKDLFNTFRIGQQERIEWLSGLTEKNVKLLLIRFAYGLLDHRHILLPSELLADAGLEYSGNTWVDTWDRKQTYEIVWATAGPVHRPKDRKIVLDDASSFLVEKAVEFRKPESSRIITNPRRHQSKKKKKKEPIIIVPASSNGRRYRKEKKRKGLNLRNIYAEAYAQRQALENKFTDDECFFILKPEKCYVQEQKISAKVKTKKTKKAANR